MNCVGCPYSLAYQRRTQTYVTGLNAALYNTNQHSFGNSERHMINTMKEKELTSREESSFTFTSVESHGCATVD